MLIKKGECRAYGNTVYRIIVRRVRFLGYRVIGGQAPKEYQSFPEKWLKEWFGAWQGVWCVAIKRKTKKENPHNPIYPYLHSPSRPRTQDPEQNEGA